MRAGRDAWLAPHVFGQKMNGCPHQRALAAVSAPASTFIEPQVLEQLDCNKTLLSTGPGRRAVVLVDQAGGMYLYPQGGVLVPRQTPRRPPLVPGPSSTPSLPWSITSAIWRNASAASLLGSNSKIDWPLIRASATFTRCGTMVSLTSGPQIRRSSSRAS